MKKLLLLTLVAKLGALAQLNVVTNDSPLAVTNIVARWLTNSVNTNQFNQGLPLMVRSNAGFSTIRVTNVLSFGTNTSSGNIFPLLTTLSTSYAGTNALSIQVPLYIWYFGSNGFGILNVWELTEASVEAKPWIHSAVSTNSGFSPLTIGPVITHGGTNVARFSTNGTVFWTISTNAVAITNKAGNATYLDINGNYPSNTIVRFNWGGTNVFQVGINTLGNMIIGNSQTFVTPGGFFTSATQMYDATVGDFYGTGSPESAVTAGVGSTYHRSNGGAGTSFYVKESGAGNTGWVGK